jgi:lipopolysaccharide/colanic/teichoic acid biosynthesis glycosyltransferase
MDWSIRKSRKWSSTEDQASRARQAYGKRFLDVALSVSSLILGAPVFALVALLVRIKLGRPVFFRQERPGLNGRPFTMIKFRTMTDERDEQGNLLPDSERMTRLGRILRSTSLDELPELINVIKGDMSLVGPRPLLLRYMPYFDERERLRFETLPGITGMAQINGRNESPWDERFAHDVWYVENQSLLLDVKILAHTLFKVLRREDVQPDPGLAVMALDVERQGKAA